MNKVTCAWCGDTWHDNHPDPPGAVIWCGQCNRAENPRWMKDQDGWSEQDQLDLESQNAE